LIPLKRKKKKEKGQMWFFVDLKYVETHDWVKVEGDHVTIGMTCHT
jgi:glycine cleavage system H lipoate-binding protein